MEGRLTPSGFETSPIEPLSARTVPATAPPASPASPVVTLSPKRAQPAETLADILTLEQTNSDSEKPLTTMEEEDSVAMEMEMVVSDQVNHLETKVKDLEVKEDSRNELEEENSDDKTKNISKKSQNKSIKKSSLPTLNKKKHKPSKIISKVGLISFLSFLA